MPAPKTRANGSLEPENRSERNLSEDSAVCGGYLEPVIVYDVIGQNLLRQYLPNGLNRILFGCVEGGELGAFMVFFKNTIFADMEVISGHAVSIISTAQNSDHGPLFQASRETRLVAQTLSNPANQM